MRPFVVVRGKDRTIEVTARNNGTITEDTLRGAFLLEQDVPIGLFRNNRALERRREGSDYVFEFDDDWMGAEFTLCWEEARRSRAITPIDQSERPASRYVNDEELAKSLHDFLFFMPRDQPALRDPEKPYVPSSRKPIEFVDGGSVTPISTSAAVTYQHRSHKLLEVYDDNSSNHDRSIVEIAKIMDPKIRHQMKVVVVDEDRDFIILRSVNDTGVFGDSYPYSLRCPRNFEWFVGFGLSHKTEKGRHITHRTGRIMSIHADYRGRYKSDSAIGGGDSGGPCFSSDRALIGILVSSTTSSPNLSKTYRQQLVEDGIDDASCHPGESLIAAADRIWEAFEKYMVRSGSEVIRGETNPLDCDIRKRRFLQTKYEPPMKRGN
ncbi:hypothetical protein M3Y98_00984800 [Aphelenchoides besseyi]|nr:hypothetical protein M3Y98_00984800 [Aphelenchoides besseyi]